MSVLNLVIDTEAAQPELRDVARCLRNVADDIEAGKYGEVVRSALVLRCANLEPRVFGQGDTTPAQAFMDFHAGAEQLMGMRRPERA